MNTPDTLFNTLDMLPLSDAGYHAQWLVRAKLAREHRVQQGVYDRTYYVTVPPGGSPHDVITQSLNGDWFDYATATAKPINILFNALRDTLGIL